MSVLQHGGTFLQRRLTKLYSDTKTSCESVTTSNSSRGTEDPEFLSLKGSIRTQTDRLLAWGLDWSDASAAQPNDIDESLTRAGFSDVVESVMSSIQDHLNDADRLLKNTGFKSSWTADDIRHSKALVSDLTACIDTLYDLSRSRRDMTASMSPSGSRSIPPPRPLKVPKDYDSKESYHGSKQQSEKRSDVSPFSNFHVTPQAPSHGQGSDIGNSFGGYFSSTKRFLIDRSALQLSGASHDVNPPPYEAVAASSNSRVVGRMMSSASPFLSSREPTVSILVEFTPMLLEAQNAVTLPASQRLEKVNQSLDQLVQNARVSHLGLLRFLGYYVDMPNARYAFVYQMPMDYFPFLRNPTDLLNEWKPKPLVSLFQSADRQDVPNLETRFRLAYDLVLAVLHLRSQNIVHGNINSSNVLIFPGLTNSPNDEVQLTENFQRPYLTSLAQFSGDGPSPEPLSSSMYRHPDDKRQLEDESAWAHDLYSLGLVLLEIGLWLPVNRCWKMKYNNAMFKQRIENLYVRRLGPKCGSAYFHMVQLCLDAPNFNLSTQPMDDLSLRVPQIYHYPVLDLSRPDSTFSFSMNFLYTICKIAWSCCRIDIFSAPPAEDLEDSLPLALVPGSEAATPIRQFAQAPMSEHPGPVAPQQASVPVPHEEMAELNENRNLEDRRVKKRTIKKLTEVDIPQENLNEWNFKLMPKLSKLLQKVLKESAESCSATLMMTGETVESAKTTICVTCSNVKKVRSAMKRYFMLDKESWDLVVLHGDVQRSRVPRSKRRLPKNTEPQVNSTAQNPFAPTHQSRPVCGASIGAFVDEQHSPPVTYGGVVLVDGVPFGMTVHHMLEPPSDDEESDEEPAQTPSRSTGGNRSRGLDPSDADMLYARCEENLPEVGLELEVSDDDDEDDDDHSVLQDLDELREDDDNWWSDDEISSDEGDDADDNVSTASAGDTSGVDPEDDLQPLVTQPALDDIREGFYPVLEDRDEEHLLTFLLGNVYASSGVRRWTRKGIKHEIDWALLKIKNDRFEPRNVMKMTGQSRIYPAICLNKVARMEDLAGTSVHCRGRTSGLQSGQISKAMSIVKMRDRQTFSTSFYVDGGFGRKYPRPFLQL